MSIDQLNEKQKLAWSLVQENKNIFLTGQAGTGKSFLIKKIVESIPKFKKTIITSMTGISAILINGVTLHSYLGIGLGQDKIEVLLDKILKNKWISKKWLSINTLIIDEVSMLSPELFDKLEEMARIIRSNDLPFGGIQILLSGDFFQLPCPEKSDDTKKFCFQAESWNRVIENNIINLTEIIRQQDDKIFCDILQKIRIGDITQEVNEILDSCLNKNLNNNLGIKPTKLYCLNKDVDYINNTELLKLNTEENNLYQFDMEFYVYNCDNFKIQDILINKYKKNTTAPDILKLCVGAQVILLKNIDFENGLVNGSRGVVVKFINDKPLVRFLSGLEIIIDWNEWTFKEYPAKIIVSQLPLKLAWVLTVHKSQGMTLDYVEVNLNQVFEYGQAYVALSRVRSLSGLSIIDINYDKIRAHPIIIEFYKNLK